MEPSPQVRRQQVLTRDTGRLLLLMAEEDLHSQKLLYKAREITRLISHMDRRSEAIALLQWMRQHIRFVRAPDGIEFVIGPAELIRLVEEHGSWSEDCDGQCALLYALLRAIGHSPRFAFVSFTGGKKIDHVYIEDLIEEQYVTLDPILPDFQVGKMLNMVQWEETLSLTNL